LLRNTGRYDFYLAFVEAKALVNYFKNAGDEEIRSFRLIGSSLAAVKAQAMGMNAIIQESIPEYAPVGLDTYIQSRNREGNDRATLLINKLQERIYKYVIKTLTKKYGVENDKWWTEGVPQTIRQNCASRWVEKNRPGICGHTLI